MPKMNDTARLKTALFIVLVAAIVASAVWQSFMRYAVSSSEYSETTVRRKLLADIRYLQRSTSPDLHLGTFVAEQLLKAIRDIPEKSPDPGKISGAIYRSANRHRQLLGDPYLWAFFQFSSHTDGTAIFQGEELRLASSSSEIGRDELEAVRLLAIKGISVLFDADTSDDFRAACDKSIRRLLDEKSYSAQTNFICSAARTFQPCFIAGRQYRLMWFPVFYDASRESPVWLEKAVENSLGEIGFGSFAGVTAILYRQEDFAVASGKHFEHALVENFRQAGCRLAYMNSAVSADVELQKIGVFKENGWLKTMVKVPEMQNRQFLLARKIPPESRSVRLLRNLIFLALLAWFSAVVYFSGNYLLMQKKVVIGLRAQLAAIVVLVLLPAFLQAMVSMERFLDSSGNSAVQGVRLASEEALDAFDKSVKLYRTRVCAFADDQIDQASHAEKPLSSISSDEQHQWLSGFLKSFLKVGVMMKNVLVVNANGDINSRFTGSNHSEEKFFQQMGASIFLPTINVMNPESARNDDRKVLAQAQAEEVLEIMGSIFPPEVFPAMSHTFARLTRLAGFGDQAFLYHRFFGNRNKVEGALMMAMFSPSLECLAFNRWFSSFSGDAVKPLWLINQKVTPDWFLKAPFGRVSSGGKFGYLRFVYDLLPAEVSYLVKISGMTREAMVTDFFWHGRNWLFATVPGRDLIDYQLSALIPLSDHYQHFVRFKQKLRFVMLTIFLLCGFVGWKLASGFVRPVMRFAETSECLMDGDLTARMNENWADEEFRLIASRFNLVADDIENGRILRKFVSEGALQTIIESEKLDVMGSIQTRNAVVMFIRLEGFWGSATRSNPAKTLADLNRFFSNVCTSVRVAGGEVSKFIAEKAMTTFFIEENQTSGSRVLAALEAAFTVVDRLRRHRLLGDSFRVRVGIAFGRVRAGIIGAESVRLEQTVIGDAVNLAARLCSQPGENDFLLCGKAREAIENCGIVPVRQIVFKKLPPQTIKGKKQAVEVFTADPVEDKV